MNQKILIHPRCATLIYHLQYATWNRRSEAARGNYKQFARSADGGHFDALDALIYLIRNVVYGKNPYPSHYGAHSASDYYMRTPENKDHETIKNIFKVRKSLKS